MNLEHATPELLTALAIAQGEIENATKNVANGAYSKNGKPSYADLAEILNTVRPVFSKQGLALIQSTEFDGALVSVSTVITHSSGGYVTSRASCVPAKSDAQGVGSATTYLRRYSAAAMSGIAQEDDDGQSASHNQKPNDDIKVKKWIADFDKCQGVAELNKLAGALSVEKIGATGKDECRAFYTKKLAELKAIEQTPAFPELEKQA